MLEPETPAQRKIRQFARLRRLGDLAMAIAEVAAQAATEAFDPAPTPSPNAPAPRGPSPATEHALTFSRASRTIRELIGLEMRLDQPGKTTFYRTPDPRRALLRRVLHDCVANDPDARQRRREIDERIEHELQADPDVAIPVDQIFGKICHALDIHVDIARVPDVLLGLIKPPNRSD